jgi:hypothetical protein
MSFSTVSAVRFVDPGLCDRIDMLMSRYPLDDIFLQKKFNDVHSLLKVNSHSAIFKKKVLEVLQKIEKSLLKRSNYNLVIRNIPKMAISRSDNEFVYVTHTAIKDTMKDFGNVSSVSMKYGVAYIQMTNNVYTHNTLNCMQMGKNIITTEIV